MSIYRFVVRFNRMDDPRSVALLGDARALGFEQLKLITCWDIYFIEGQLSQEECQRLALELLTDPVAQTAEWSELPAVKIDPQPDTRMKLSAPPASWASMEFTGLRQVSATYSISNHQNTSPLK